MTAACLLCSFLLLQAGAPPPQQPADSIGTAVLRGTVTDKDTGEPMARAVVMLRLMPGNRTLERLTSERGTFEFTKLPAGPVHISATAGEHRMTHVPGTFPPQRSDGGSVAIRLSAGQVRGDVNLVLARAFAISGRVVDEAGEPLAGVSVGLRDGPSRVSGFHSTRSTDDRGQFRIFGLVPGRYLVCAAALSSPTFDRRNDRRPRRVPRPSCYPSAVGEDEASPVAVEDRDVEGIEIRAPRVAMVSVAGTVVTAAGEMGSRTQVTLTTIRRGMPTGSVGTTIGEDGRFTIVNIVPGAYVLSASSEPASRERQGTGLEYGEVDLGTLSTDLDGVVIAMHPPVHVAGRMVFEGAAAPRLDAPVVVARRGKTRGGAPGWSDARVGADLTFTLTNLFGPQRLIVSGVPRGWVVKSVRYRGRDITNTFAEFRNGPDELEIVLSDRGAILTGTVADERGNPAAGARVFMFPADADRRNPQALSFGGVLKDGRFTLPPHRADDYLVLAVDAADAERFTDERSYEQLAPYAERVTLLENDRRAIDLRVVRIPEERKVP
jgi:protocatechuate 3,4-dioxygenase beta subunit